jgi:secreted protein with Ig-like and vWFA domain
MWYAQQAAAKGVTVYTVGIGDGVNADFLETMATGIDPRSGGTPVVMFAGATGQYFPAVTPDDLGQIIAPFRCSASAYLPIILK